MCLVFDLNGLDDYWLDWAVGVVSCCGGNLLHYFLGVFVGDFTEDGVAHIQMRSWCHRDEELRAVGAGASVCHCQQEWAVELQFWVEFVFEAVAWAAHAGAGWVAALDHEPFDDAVEDGAVIEWPFVRASGVLLGVWRGALCEGDKVFDSFWCMVAEQFDFNVTKVGVQDCSCSLKTHEAHLKARQAKYR